MPFRPLRGAVTAAWMIAIAVGGVAAQAATPSRAPAARPLTTPIPRDPSVIVGRLPNGMRFYVRANHRPEKRAELRLVVDAGSVLEDDDQRGLAHLTEHMAFNGTTHFARQELVNYLESTGVRFGADLNASTGFDETIYELTVPTDSARLLSRGFDILHDWATGVTFDPQELARERGVVLEEWRLGRGAQQRMLDKQFPILFKGSRYATRLPIGDTAVILHAGRDKLVRFYHDWYRPDLLAVVAVGDFDPRAVAKRIRQEFASVPRPRVERKRPIYPVPDYTQPLVAIATDPEATRSSVAIYYKQPLRGTRTIADYREQLVEALYNSMLNERFEEIAQRPDAPFLGASSAQGRLIRSKEVYALNAVVKDGGIDRGLAALLTEGERVAQHGFTATELARQKSDLLRGMEQAYAERDKTSSAAFVQAYIQNFLEQEPIPSVAQEYALYQQLLPGIQLGEVNALARRWLGGTSRVILVNAPQKPSVPVPSEERLLAVVDSVQRVQVAAYTDSTSTGPLVATPHTPGPVTSTTSLATLGVTEWTLSNGVRVMVKPTDFKDDEIVFRAWAPGGTSVAPDSIYPSAALSSTVVEVGGLGRMSAVTLQKALAGKAVSVSPFVDALTQGLSGSGSPKDVETMFQLIHLYFTGPRADSAAFEAFESRAHSLLANRSANPEAAFEDTLDVTLYQHHPRVRPPTPGFYDSVRMTTALDFYRERFANAGAFTFVFVGNIDTATFRPLVERWLGSLPSTTEAEHWRDVGLAYPTSVVKREVHKGEEPKSETSIVFTGPLDFTWENVTTMSALGDLLEIKLRERLREALGGTYSVSVAPEPSAFPRPTYAIHIDYGSAPARAAELTQAVFAEIDSVKANGASAEDLQKVRETMIRERETNLRRNGVWAGLLFTYEFNGWDPSLILRYSDQVRKIDSPLLREAARRWLDPERYVQVTLFPHAATP